MPTPSTTLSTLRPDLAAFLEFDAVADRGGFIAPMAAPMINVGLQSDNPGKIPIEALLHKLDGTSTLRASGSNYKRGDWEFEKYTYATQEHGWEEPVDDRDRARYQHIIGGAERIAAERALSWVIGNYEKRVADMLFNATTWTGAALTTTITNEWDDFTNAVPLDDVLGARQKVYDGSGMDANALIVNRTVFQNLQQCDQVQDVLASSGAGESYKAGNITAAKLAEIFDLVYVLVAGGTRNGNNPGQSAGPERIWSGEYAMVCRVATGADAREPCVARTFHWTEDGSSPGGTVETYREEGARSDIVRVRMDTDEVVMYTQLGHLLSNATT